MVAAIEEKKRFKIGTTGWRASDLEDPRIERQWLKGRYEIVSGVLTQMPPAYFDSSGRLMNLVLSLNAFAKANEIEGTFAAECDVVISESKVARADMIWLSQEQKRKQERAVLSAGKSDLRRARVLVPPSLVIESVSYGHEDHDRVTKFAWYAEFGVPHYWIFDSLHRTLECYTLFRGKYKLAASGKDDAQLAVPLFKGLKIKLREIWKD